MKTTATIALAVLLAITLAAPWIAPHEPTKQYREWANAAPGGKFLLGTDEFGRDIFSRLLHAGRWSMLTGCLATFLSLASGTALGLAASYAPRWVDNTIMWLADLTLTLPWLYLLFAVRGLLPLSLQPEIALLAVVALVGCAGWATPARLVQSTARTVLVLDYVRASRAFGATPFYVLWHHVTPSLAPVLTAQLFILMPQYVLAESALSLLGLGLSEPTPTWGTMLVSLRHTLAHEPHWWMLAPIMPLSVLTLAASILAEKQGER